MKRALTFIVAMAVASQLANWTVFAAEHQSGAQGLCQNNAMAGPGALILFDVPDFNNARHGVAELDFVIANGVTAKEGHARFGQFVQSAAHDVAKDRKIEPF